MKRDGAKKRQREEWPTIRPELAGQYRIEVGDVHRSLPSSEKFRILPALAYDFSRFMNCPHVALMARNYPPSWYEMPLCDRFCPFLLLLR
jgi:hypothetical protein